MDIRTLTAAELDEAIILAKEVILSENDAHGVKSLLRVLVNLWQNA